MKSGNSPSRQRQRGVLQPLVEACGCPVNRSPNLIGARSPIASSQKFPPFLVTILLGAQFALPVGLVLPPNPVISGRSRGKVYASAIAVAILTGPR